VCFHTFTRKFHPTGIVAGGTAAGAFSPAAALPFLEEITLEKHKECKNCWARNLCVGACPNENLVNAGTTQKSDSKNCRFIQAMYNDLIHAYLELTVENKKQLLG